MQKHDAWLHQKPAAYSYELQLLHAREGGSRLRVRFDERWGYVQRAIIDSDEVDLSWERIVSCHGLGAVGRQMRPLRCTVRSV